MWWGRVFLFACSETDYVIWEPLDASDKGPDPDNSMRWGVRRGGEAWGDATGGGEGDFVLVLLRTTC